MIRESPIGFPNEYLSPSGVKLSYKYIIEVCQGGPEVGNLQIGDSLLKGYWFGGPLLFWNNFVVVPLFERPKFRIALVNIDTLQVTGIVGQFDVLVLSEVNDNVLSFYSDLFYSEMKHVDFLNCETVELEPNMSLWEGLKQLFKKR